MNRHLHKIVPAVPAMAGTPSRIVASACIMGLFAGLADFAILTLLAYLGFSRLTLRLRNAALTGAVTGAFVWALLAAVSSRRRYLEAKLQVVANLNHELRNALEVILQSGYLPHDQRYSALRDSAKRIDMALTELLAEARPTDSGSYDAPYRSYSNLRSRLIGRFFRKAA